MPRPVVARFFGSFVLASVAVWVRAGGLPVGRLEEHAQPILALVGIVLVVIVLGAFGLVAHALAIRAPRVAAGLCAVALVASFRGLHAVDVSHALYASASFTPCVVAGVVTLVLALAGLRWRAAGVAFAGGLGLGSYIDGPAWPLLLVTPLLTAGLVHAAPDEGRWRHAVSMLAAGIAGGLALRGLGMDMTLLVSDPPAHWLWHPGPLGSTVVRVALELAVVLACVWLGRGRTAGLLAFVLASSALASLGARSTLPSWRMEAGDFFGAWDLHPLWSAEPLWAAVALAVTPWVVPFARALRAPRPA